MKNTVNTMASNNVDCFFDIRLVCGSKEEAEVRSPEVLSPMEEKITGVIADIILLLRTPAAKVIRFLVTLGLVGLFVTLLAVAGIRGHMGFGALALRGAAVVLFGYLGTRRCCD